MRILLVEDDTLLGDGVRAGLKQAGFAVDWVQDGLAAKLALEAEAYAVMVLDLGLPKLSGLDLLKWLRERHFKLPVLILTARDTVLDAYCGMGTIGQYLSRFCEKVIGIESHPTAVEDALRSAGKNRIGNISFYKGRVEHVLSSQLKPGGKYKFKVMALDPPRAGLHPSAREAIAAHAPEKIVYVSCNTATLARDMGEFMKKGYELRSVQPVDMFPHTAHIETVSVLQRKT